jgi:hypothetical protein
MASDHVSKPTSYELAVQIRDAAKAKLDEAYNVLLTDLVPPRMKGNAEFMDFIAGITFSDLNDHHIFLTSVLPSDGRLKLIAEIFEKSVLYPYRRQYEVLKSSYATAKQAVADLERLEAYVAENST